MKEEAKTSINFDIDLVYTWVDGNDSEWRKRRDAIMGRPDKSEGENHEGRYTDNDELKYSLRSVELYAPWIRRIFIVTDRQIPEWLDASNPKIRIVDHSEILPPEALPTFNSNIIEHALHRIPELSEHFLYANDDMLINREVKPSDFFTAEGHPIVRLKRCPFLKVGLFLKKNFGKKGLNHYNKALHNSAKLVEKRWGKYITGIPHHNIDAMHKSINAHVHELFGIEIGKTWANRFRSDNDIQKVIYSYVPMAEKNCEVEYVNKKTSYRIHIQRHYHYDKIMKYNPKFFCVNDSEHATDEDRRMAKEFLARIFPEKSSFEK